MVSSAIEELSQELDPPKTFRACVFTEPRIGRFIINMYSYIEGVDHDVLPAGMRLDACAWARALTGGIDKFTLEDDWLEIEVSADGNIPLHHATIEIGSNMFLHGYGNIHVISGPMGPKVEELPV